MKGIRMGRPRTNGRLVFDLEALAHDVRSGARYDTDAIRRLIAAFEEAQGRDPAFPVRYIFGAPVYCVEEIRGWLLKLPLASEPSKRPKQPKRTAAVY